jgi:hypothetical protein
MFTEVCEEFSTLKMEAANSFEISVYNYQTTLRHIPKDSYLYSHRPENSEYPSRNHSVCQSKANSMDHSEKRIFIVPLSSGLLNCVASYTGLHVPSRLFSLQRKCIGHSIKLDAIRVGLKSLLWKHINMKGNSE